MLESTFKGIYWRSRVTQPVEDPALSLLWHGSLAREVSNATSAAGKKVDSQKVLVFSILKSVQLILGLS